MDSVTLGALLIAAVAVTGITLESAGAAEDRPTAAFRAEHVEVRQHLAEAKSWVGELGGQKAEGARAKAQKVVMFFEKHIKPHADWEERVLYPLVDRLAGGGEHRFTASMRHEHRIVGRWVADLSQRLAQERFDARAFARRADSLIGLVDAHFEVEEEVLLPLIDAKMTREEFEGATRGPASTH